MSDENYLMHRITRKTRIEFPVDWLDNKETKHLSRCFVGGFENAQYQVICVPNNGGFVSISMTAYPRMDFNAHFAVKNTGIKAFIPSEPLEVYPKGALSPYCPSLIACNYLISHLSLQEGNALMYPTIQIMCDFNFYLRSEILLPAVPSPIRIFSDKNTVKLWLQDGSYNVNCFFLKSISTKFRHSLGLENEVFPIADYRLEIVKRCLDIALGIIPDDCSLRQILKMQQFSYDYGIIGLQIYLNNLLSQQVTVDNFQAILLSAIKNKSLIVLKSCYVLAKKSCVFDNCSLEEQEAMKNAFSSFHPIIEVDDLKQLEMQDSIDKKNAIELNFMESQGQSAVLLSTFSTTLHFLLSFNENEYNATSLFQQQQLGLIYNVEPSIECHSGGERTVSFYLHVNRKVLTYYTFKINGKKCGSRCIQACADQRIHLFSLPVQNKNASFADTYEANFEFSYEKICDMPPSPRAIQFILYDQKCIELALFEDTFFTRINRDFGCGISPFFCEIFAKSNWSGIKLRNVKLRDLMRTFRFILGCQLTEISISEVLAIMYIANDYKINGLKTHMEEWMEQNLTKELFCDVAIYAEYSDNEILKEHCAQFYAEVLAKGKEHLPDITRLSGDMIQFFQTYSNSLTNEINHVDNCK